jgi:hypothetical protein
MAEGYSVLEKLYVRDGYPAFGDLPWDWPIAEWDGRCSRLEQVKRGLSRHPVVFANYNGGLFALKEMPRRQAEQEFEQLMGMERLHLPAVTPVGFAVSHPGGQDLSVLITRFLDNSLPYRWLYIQGGLERYRQHLLDAIAGLMVQLHLAGVYWGDCSLSNTLFRRDAGTLQAYLVDAETAELYPENLLPSLRFYDLEVMEENVNGDLADLKSEALLAEGIPVTDMGRDIRMRYQGLWEEITHEDIINPGEHFRIQERIRALNSLGYSVGEVKLTETEGGSQLRLGVMVSDRHFHHDRLLSLTGIDAEERQAQRFMNEIQELKAILSSTHNRSTPMSVAAYHWLENAYQPAVAQLAILTGSHLSSPELYFQVLEHKWYLSEKAQRDVGLQAAIEDYIQRFGDELAAGKR